MYLHLGQSTVIIAETVIGMFDIDKTTVSQRARDYLSFAQKAGKIINVSQELPRSFIVTDDGTVYISQLAVSTLFNRMNQSSLLSSGL